MLDATDVGLLRRRQVSNLELTPFPPFLPRPALNSQPRSLDCPTLRHGSRSLPQGRQARASCILVRPQRCVDVDTSDPLPCASSPVLPPSAGRLCAFRHHHLPSPTANRARLQGILPLPDLDPVLVPSSCSPRAPASEGEAGQAGQARELVARARKAGDAQAAPVQGDVPESSQARSGEHARRGRV